MRLRTFIGLVLCPIAFLSADASELPWKTLRSDFGKFTLQYPSSWSVFYDSEEDNPEKLGLFPIRIEGPSKEISVKGRRVVILIDCLGTCDPARTTVATSKALRDRMIGHGDRYNRYANEHETKLGGVSAYETTDLSTFPGAEPVVRYVFVLHRKRGLMLSISEIGKGAESVTSEADWRYSPEVRHILESFRFTN